MPTRRNRSIPNISVITGGTSEPVSPPAVSPPDEAIHNHITRLANWFCVESDALEDTPTEPPVPVPDPYAPTHPTLLSDGSLILARARRVGMADRITSDARQYMEATESMRRSYEYAIASLSDEADLNPVGWHRLERPSSSSARASAQREDTGDSPARLEDQIQSAREQADRLLDRAHQEGLVSTTPNLSRHELTGTGELSRLELAALEYDTFFSFQVNSPFSATREGYEMLRANALSKATSRNTESTLTSYKGKEIKRGVAVRLTNGNHRGEWASIADPDTVRLWSVMGDAKYATRQDELIEFYPELNGPSAFCHASQSIMLRTDITTGRLTRKGNLTSGYVDADRTDWFSGGIRCYHTGDSFLNEEVAAMHGVRYSEFQGQYWPVDDYGFDHYVGNGNAAYHFYNRETDDEVRGVTPFTFGVEVEKEDRDGLAFPHEKLYQQTKWVKERDGSLSEEGGYELVSPVHSLMSDKLFDTIQNNENLLALVNGGYSGRCGGHIHFGVRGLSGLSVFESYVAGYLPLLYSLYPARLGRTYCMAKGKQAIVQGDKYQAVRLLNNRIEFRIFPAVRDINNLRWRVGLVRIIAKRPLANYTGLLRDIGNSESELYQHLSLALSAKSMATLPGRVSEWADKLTNDEEFLHQINRLSPSQIAHAYPTEEDEFFGDEKDGLLPTDDPRDLPDQPHQPRRPASFQYSNPFDDDETTSGDSDDDDEF